MNYTFKIGIDRLCAEKNLALNLLAKEVGLQPNHLKYYYDKDQAGDVFLDKLEQKLSLEPGYFKRAKHQPSISVIRGVGNNAVNSQFVVGGLIAGASMAMGKAKISNEARPEAPKAAAKPENKPQEDPAYEYELYMLRSERDLLKSLFIAEFNAKAKELRKYIDLLNKATEED